MPLLRCTVLKAAVKEEFPITHALMGNNKANTSKLLEDKLIEMVVICEEENVFCKDLQIVTACSSQLHTDDYIPLQAIYQERVSQVKKEDKESVCKKMPLL